jgi:hypothetical protein
MPAPSPHNVCADCLPLSLRKTIQDEELLRMHATRHVGRDGGNRRLGVGAKYKVSNRDMMQAEGKERDAMQKRPGLAGDCITPTSVARGRENTLRWSRQ